MQFRKKEGIQRLFKAVQNTLAGLVGLWLNEAAFRLELYLSAILLPIIFLLNVAGLLKLLLLLLFLLLLVVEAINSALEAVVDRISLEIHAQSKLIKDIGSAAVGITLVMNLLVWIYVLFLA